MRKVYSELFGLIRIAYPTNKGFEVRTYLGTHYYVYPKTKGKMYPNMLADLFTRTEKIWK